MLALFPSFRSLDINFLIYWENKNPNKHTKTKQLVIQKKKKLNGFHLQHHKKVGQYRPIHQIRGHYKRPKGNPIQQLDFQQRFQTALLSLFH